MTERDKPISRGWPHAGPARGMFVLLAAAAAAGPAGAAGPEDYRQQYAGRIFTNEAGVRLPYRLLKPQDRESGRSYPLVLFLHGAGERGEDNQRQLVHGLNELARPEMMARYPCFVVAPQCPEDQQWVDVPWSADAHVLPPRAAPALQQALDLVSALEQEFPVDRQRVYITGLSMGGFGVWDALARQPQRFAAAIPVCGGGDPATAAAIAAVPLWAFHGDSDPAVTPHRSRDMIQALRQAGAAPRYTEYPDTGHDSWTATYSNPQVYAWLFAQRRTDPQ